MKTGKKRTGLVILIVVLSIIILLPVGAYAFLSLTQFGGGGLSPDESYEATPFTGKAELSPDGSVSAILGEEDVYYLAARSDVNSILKQLPKDIKLFWWRISLCEGGVDVYANGEAYGFIPLSLKVNIALRASEDASIIFAEPKSVMLGKHITLAADKLYSFGLQPSYTLYTQGMGFPSSISDIEFLPEGIRVTAKLEKEPFERMMALARANAYETYVFSGDALADGNPLYPLAADNSGAPISGDDIFAGAAATRDYKKALCGLAALCEKESASAELSVFSEFEKRFFLNWDEQIEQDMRESYAEARISGRRAYETMLNALREKYKAMELTLDTCFILDSATNEKVKLASLPGGESINDDTSRIILLHSFEPTYAVKTDDMPALKDVPATSVKVYRDEYYMRPYDLGVLLVLPTGEHALMYYELSGRFVVHMVSDFFYHKHMEDSLLQFATADLIPRARELARQDEQDDYCILYPET